MIMMTKMMVMMKVGTPVAQDDDDDDDDGDIIGADVAHAEIWRKANWMLKQVSAATGLSLMMMVAIAIILIILSSYNHHINFCAVQTKCWCTSNM